MWTEYPGLAPPRPAGRAVGAVGAPPRLRSQWHCSTGLDSLRALPLVLALLLLVLAGCDNSWRTDMWYQPSRRPEDLPRPEPEHGVPLGAGPRYVDRDDTETLANPVPATPVSLARGRAIFVARCAPCHGPEGHGGGPVSKFFPEAPDFAYTTIRKRSDGFIWGTITYGGKAMPPHREGLTDRERWDVVNEVRHIQATSAAIEAPATPVPAAPTP